MLSKNFCIAKQFVTLDIETNYCHEGKLLLADPAFLPNNVLRFFINNVDLGGKEGRGGGGGYYWASVVVIVQKDKLEKSLQSWQMTLKCRASTIFVQDFWSLIQMSCSFANHTKTFEIKILKEPS